MLAAAARIASGQWFKYSDQQKVEVFLFGSSDMSNNENVEIFSHVQHFIRESKRFSFVVIIINIINLKLSFLTYFVSRARVCLFFFYVVIRILV